MILWRSAHALLGVLAIVSGKGVGAVQRPIETDWRKLATPEDRARLRSWRTAWMAALAKARRARTDAAAIRAQGALFDPDRAIAGYAPPPGTYRCRVFKLGASGTAMQDYTPYPAFTCRIDAEGSVASFYMIDGSQRPAGLIFAGDAGRGVFLGTMMLGDERSAIRYGRDATRNMAGLVERIGDRRWRIVLPYPRFESLLDVIELVPAN